MVETGPRPWLRQWPRFSGCCRVRWWSTRLVRRRLPWAPEETPGRDIALWVLYSPVVPKPKPSRDVFFMCKPLLYKVIQTPPSLQHISPSRTAPT
jgi:hypothetical protein